MKWSYLNALLPLHIPHLDNPVSGQGVHSLPSVLQHDGGDAGVVPVERHARLSGHERVPNADCTVRAPGYENVGLFVKPEALDALDMTQHNINSSLEIRSF